MSRCKDDLCVCSIAQLCPTLCDPMDCSLPGSSGRLPAWKATVHGVFPARILEWVDISSFRGSSCSRDWTCISSIGRQVLYYWATWEALKRWINKCSYIFVVSWEGTHKSFYCPFVSFILSITTTRSKNRQEKNVKNFNFIEFINVKIEMRSWKDINYCFSVYWEYTTTAFSVVRGNGW